MNETYELLKNYVEFIVNDLRIIAYPQQFESMENKDFFNGVCGLDEDDIEMLSDMLYYTQDEDIRAKIFLNQNFMDSELYGCVVDVICDYIHLGWEGMQDD